MNMTDTIQLNFDHHPSLVTPYLKGLITRRKGIKNGIPLPRIQTTWKDLTFHKRHLNQFIDICELNPQQEIPFEYPLTLVFPSHMHILGHSQFPLSPFSMLQTRIQIRQNRALSLNTPYTLHCQIFDRRDTAKGMNLGVCSQLCCGKEMVWESINTYFFRNMAPTSSNGDPTQKRSHDELPERCEVRSFTIPAKKGFAFARLSGDLNGIHYSSSYARLLGFKRDFCHAQRSVAICMNQLPFLQNSERIELDVALKGPVYYDNELHLKSASVQNGYRADLLCGNYPKPALVFDINTDG